MSTTTTPTEIAKNFAARAKARGFEVEISDRGVVTISLDFAPNDRSAYVAADMDAYPLLMLLPQTSPGSVWGTTSDGIGGHAGLTGGYYRLSKSGVSKRVISALRQHGGHAAR